MSGKRTVICSGCTALILDMAMDFACAIHYYGGVYDDDCSQSFDIRTIYIMTYCPFQHYNELNQSYR